MKCFFSIILFLANSFLFAQSNFTSDIDFVVDKIKNTYAGYRDKVKGNEFEKLVKEVRNSNSRDTFAQLSKLTNYFNDLHLGIYQIYWPKNIDSNQCKLNYESVKNIDKANSSYWIDDLNQNIICLRKHSDKYFAGFIVESKKEVPLGLCILKFKAKNKSTFLAEVIDIEEWYKAFITTFFKDDKTIIIKGYKKWKKLENYAIGTLKSKKEFDLSTPSFKIIDSGNVLLTMPSFSRYYIPKYDSIIKINKSRIGQSKNLIIDLRNNRGGVVGNFYSLFPFVGTNVIMRGGYSSLSSEDLINDFNKKREKYFKLNDTVMVKEYDKYISRLIEKKNDFLFNKSDTFSVNEIDFFPMVKKIGIITNNSSVSAAELMLLYFKQSNKVKIFGEATGGLVDYLDEMRFQTPYNKFNLFIPTTKREITPIFPAYDKTGINPDINISDDEPDWIDFVKRYYEKK